MDSEEDALLEEKVKDDQIIDDRISENDLKSDNFSNGNCNIITSPVPSRRSDEPTELSFEKSKNISSWKFQLFVVFVVSVCLSQIELENIS